MVAGIKERVERHLEHEFQKGRLRETHWSINTSLIFDRSGTSRFYGIGNDSLWRNVTNYTASQLLGQAQCRLQPESHLAAAVHPARAAYGDHRGHAGKGSHHRDPLPDVHGLGVTNEVLNQVALVYDTRDDADHSLARDAVDGLRRCQRP